MKTLRQKAREDPYLAVTRQEANEILDFEWECGLFPEEVRLLWSELEAKYGLKPIRVQADVIRRYRLYDVKEALASRERGEQVATVGESQEEDKSWPPPIVAREEGDEDVVTGPEACERLGLRRSNPTDFIQRLGVEPVAKLHGRNGYFQFRYGDVRLAHERRWREQYED